MHVSFKRNNAISGFNCILIFRFAIKSGYPDVHHVTLPRTGAMEVIMNALTNSGARKKNGLTHNNGRDSFPLSKLSITKLMQEYLSVSG